MHGRIALICVLGLALTAPVARATPPAKRVVKAPPAQVAKPASKKKKKKRKVSRRLIRKALKMPRGSVSIGSTSAGRLVGGKRFRLRGLHYRFFPHIKDRETNYGTRELYRLVSYVGRKVARKHPKTSLRLGNIGRKQGGKIKWSISHRCGRDVDIAIFTTTRRGKHVKLGNYAKFDRRGQARGGRYRFDLARNFTLVKALLSYKKAPVQWIFIYRPLKKKLIEYAREKGASPKLLERMSKVLRMPSDSAPHRDHFHVRIFCSVEDRLHGCLDRRPHWEWVDRGDEAYAKRVALLIEISRLSDAKLRVQAIDKLHALRAEAAAPRLVEALEDPEAPVREAALKALKRLAGVDQVLGIMAALGRAEDPEWASALFKLLKRMKDPRTRALALGILTEPAKHLRPKVVAADLTSLKVIAAKILAKHGRRPSAPALRKLLADGDVKLRRAAHAALRQITNQPVKGRLLKSNNPRRRKRVIARWDGFFKLHGRASWLQWIKVGFEARRIRFKGKMMRIQNVPALLKALAHRDKEAHRNALRVLIALTGHDSGSWRSKRKQIRHWRRWWRDNRVTLLKQSKKVKP